MINIKKTISYLIVLSLLLNLIPNTIFAQNDITNTDGVPSIEGSIENLSDYPDIAPSNNLSSVSNTLQQLAGLNSKVLDINGFDENKLKQWEEIGKVLLNAKQNYDPANPDENNLFAQYTNNGNAINDSIAEAAGANTLTMSNFDLRVLESLGYLSANKYNGGAGREYLNIASITRGYNTLNDNSSRGKTAKEADGWTIAVDEDALNHISPHNSDWGSAVSITQIDYVRGTILVYDQDDKLIKKQKMPNKIPINVEWQTDYRPDSNQAFSLTKSRSLLSQSILNALFKGNINQAFNSITASFLADGDLGFELPSSLPYNADNLSQMVTQNIGLSSYLDQIGLPDFQLGYDLSSNGYNLGSKVIEILAGNNLTAAGLKGNSLIELETNIGREWVASQLGLPENSLYGDNSQQMIANIGIATMAQKLNIEQADLKNLSSGNTALRIGQGYLNKNLNIAYDTFTDKNDTFEKIKNYIGQEKANYLFSNPSFIDQYLGLAQGSTQALVSGTTSPSDFAKNLGQQRINEFTNVFGNNDYQKKYWDALFGISAGTISQATFGSDANKQKDWFIENYSFNDALVSDCTSSTTQIKAEDYFNKCYVAEFANNSTKLYSWLSQYAELQDTNSNAENKSQNLVQRFFDGDNDVFYEIGLRTLTRTLTTNQDNWSYLENYFRNNQDKTVLAEVESPSLVNNDKVKAVYSEYYNEKYNFSNGDLERIFMLNRADHVFARIGKEKIDDAIVQSGQTDDAVISEDPIDYDTYYSDTFFQDNFNNLAENEQLQKLKTNYTQASEIIVTALQGSNYKEQTEEDYKNKNRVIAYNNYIDKISYLFSQLETNPSIKDSLDSARAQIFDLMKGQSITDPKSYSEDQISENFTQYNLTYGTFQGIYDVIQENTTIYDYSKQIGLELLSDAMLEHPEPSVLQLADNSIIQSSYQQSLTRLNEIAGEEFISTEQEIINDSFLFSEGSTETITNQDVLALLNGSPLYFMSKIGSQIADNAYKTTGFYQYNQGKLSGSDLAAGSAYSKDNENQTINTIFRLFPKTESIYQLGAQVANQNYGMDILGFYTNETFNAAENVGGFIESVFKTDSYQGIINQDNLSLASEQIVKDFAVGNLENFLNRVQANANLSDYKQLLNQYKDNYPDVISQLNLTLNDFMPVDEMDFLLDYINDSNNISLLKEFGKFQSELSNYSFDRSFNTLQLSILNEVADVWGTDANPKDMLDLYRTLLNPASSGNDITSKFANFLADNTKMFDGVDEQYKGLLKDFMTGNLDTKNSIDFIKNVWLKDESQSTKDQIGSALTVFSSLNSGNLNSTDLANAFKALNPDIDQTELNQLTGSFSAFQKFNNGDFSGALNAMEQYKIITDQDGDINKLSGTMAAFQKFQNGDYEGAVTLLNSKENLLTDAGDLKTLQGVMGAYGAYNSGDYSQAIEKLKTSGIDLGNTDKMTGIFTAYKDFNNGNYSGALQALKDKKVFGNSTAGFDKAIGALGAYDSFAKNDYSAAINQLKNNKVLPSDLKTDKITGALEVAANLQNGNYSQAIESLKTNKLLEGDTASLDKASGLLTVAGSIQAGNYSQAIASLDDAKLFGKMTDSQKAKLTGNLEIVGSIADGDYVSTFKNLGEKTDLFKGMSTTQKNAIVGLAGMSMSGNISYKQIAVLGSKYFGFKGVSLGKYGMISPTTLVNSLTNPQALVAQVLSNYLTTALSGMLGIGTFGASIVAGFIVGSVFGGSQRIEYQYTACGYYPTYDKEETIEGQKYENELGIVNDAKSKAVASNSAEDWGDYIYKKDKYDTIPTDEINEDDMQTTDEKYSSGALANIDNQVVQEQELSTVVGWAETKDNQPVRCMDADGGGGVFVNDTPGLTDDQKQQVSKYKIKVLLGNLLYMRDRTKKYNVMEELDNLAYHQLNQNFAQTVIDSLSMVTKAYAADEQAVTIEDIDPDYDPDGAKQTQDYQRLLDFNTSGQDLRPTQILTYGGDDAEHNQSFGPNTGVTLDTGGYLANNILFESVNTVLKYFSDNTSQAKAIFENTSLETLEQNDVAHFYVIRDRLWGDSYGSPGSQDIILSEGFSREGFGLNQKMYDRINYSY